jgi:hypothetical protein
MNFIEVWWLIRAERKRLKINSVENNFKPKSAKLLLIGRLFYRK